MVTMIVPLGSRSGRLDPDVGGFFLPDANRDPVRLSTIRTVNHFRYNPNSLSSFRSLLIVILRPDEGTVCTLDMPADKVSSTVWRD
jgi:hypothetical protein